MSKKNLRLSTFRLLSCHSTIALILATSSLKGAVPVPASPSTTTAAEPPAPSLPVDPAVARAQFEALQKKAQQNDPDAWNQLGMAYLEGSGVSPEDAKAAECFRKAGDLGSWKGQTNLGLMYARGRGVAKDSGEALKWFERAANQGVPEAQLELAAVLDQGKDLPKNFQEAFKWYQKAATGGSALAAAELGRIYLSGEDDGITQDYAVAAKWFRQAAEAGNPAAQNSLGVLLQYGRGVEKNVDEAAEWYERAANQGDARAQANMGMLYCFANGLYRDNIAAYKWFSLSAEQDWVVGKNILAQFKHALNSDELAEAQNQIKLFKDAHQKASAPAASPQK